MHSYWPKYHLAAMALLIFLYNCESCAAEITLEKIYQNGMVWQRNTPLTLAGWALPGEKVVVTQGGKVLGECVGLGLNPQPCWKVPLPAMPAGPVADITISGPKNSITLTQMLAGEVWLCSGQSNMTMTLKNGPWCSWGGVENQDHVVAVSHDEDLRFNNTGDEGWLKLTSDTAPRISAVAYAFARKLRARLNVPVGLIIRSVGGTYIEEWTPKDLALGDPEYRERERKAAVEITELKPILAQEKKEMDDWFKASGEAKIKDLTPPPKPNDSALKINLNRFKDLNAILAPGGLYPRIHALVPMSIRGVIWYQGESNARRPENYQHLLALLIQGWRNDFGPDCPFLIAQLSSFGHPLAHEVHYGNWSVLREEQYKATLKIPHTGVVPTMDVGDAVNIHFPRKFPVGERLADLALKQVYQGNGIATGPRYAGVVFQGNKALVTFSADSGDLELHGKEGFQLAGPDKKWHEAEPRIRGNTVEVSSEAVSQPVAIRYAWLNFTHVSLFNAAGWPAFPFRSDSWEDEPADVAKK